VGGHAGPRRWLGRGVGVPAAGNEQRDERRCRHRNERSGKHGPLGYRAGSLVRVASTVASTPEAKAQAEMAANVPNWAARMPPLRGPSAKPTAFALAATPKTRAWTAA